MTDRTNPSCARMGYVLSITSSTWFVVQQYPGHPQRVISRQPSPVPPFVLSVDGRQIEFIGNIRYQSCQVVFRQPVL